MALNNNVQKLENNHYQIADKLQSLLKSHNMSVNQVAQALGIPMMTVRRLASGETTDPRISTLKLIADHFDISVDSLINAEELPSLQPYNKPKSCCVPILDWDIAAERSIKDLDLTTWKEWQHISLNEQELPGKNSFALESRPSMYPRFPQGTVFIFDPDACPIDGDIVLVKIQKNNELTIRELYIDPPEWQLRSVVSNAKILHYNEDDFQIIGVNLLTLLYKNKGKSKAY